MEPEATRVACRIAAVPDSAIDQLAAAQGCGGYVDAQRTGCLTVQVELLDATGHRQVIRVFAQQAPASELGHEPHAVGQPGVVHLSLSMEADGVRVLPAIAETVAVLAEQTRLDAVHRGVQVIGTA